MRVAVCISGQLREWLRAKENQKQFWESIGDRGEVDYFIHTWNYSGDREGVSQPYIWRKVEQKEFDQIVEWYKPKKYIFDNKVQSFFYENDHWMSLFYSLSQSIMLKRQYELENNFEYDVVIKSRPDIVFNPRSHFTEDYMCDGFLYTTHAGEQLGECGLININDCCFYANSYTMDMIVDLYQYRERGVHINGNLDNPEGYLNIQSLGPGTTMGGFFMDYGITPNTIQPHRYAFIEVILRMGFDPSLDLLKLKDFRKVSKLHFEWYTK
jgi:hypothetical protein